MHRLIELNNYLGKKQLICVKVEGRGNNPD